MPKQFKVVLPDSIRAPLRALAQEEGVTESELVRRALREWLQNRTVPVVGGPPGMSGPTSGA